MAFFTNEEIRRAAANATSTQLFENDATIAARAETYFQQQASLEILAPKVKFDIFLSHAYADKIVVAGLYAVLTSTGFTVYVDWIQDRHRLDRSQVTAANAAILRER